MREKITEIRKQLKQFENGKLYFYSEYVEDYTYGWQDWTTEYYDKDNVGLIIDNAVQYAVQLVNYKKLYIFVIKNERSVK